jgi:hypothetical protein
LTRKRDLAWVRTHAAGGEANPGAGASTGISEAEVVKNVMLKETIDGEFTTAQDVAEQQCSGALLQCDFCFWLPFSVED